MTPESSMNADEAGDARRNPYIGPVPFLEGQTLYGRERETDELADLLVSKRIVLLFAPSGAGKTSLIQAALVPRLRDLYHLRPLPTVRLTHRNDAIAGQRSVNRYALSTMRCLERRYPSEQQLSDEQLAALTLAGYFEHRLAFSRDAGKPEYWLLVLDQFEELFTLDPLDWDVKEAFLKDLGNVLAGAKVDAPEAENQGPPIIWALFSMREDRVAELQPFLDLIPTALAFRYRLDPLERDEALDAIVKPAGAYMTAAAAVRLVDDLRTIQLRTPEGAEVVSQGRFVEPVQLQVVCRRLWDKVVAKDNRPIELADVTTAQGASEVDRALGDYFDSEIESAANATQVPQRSLRDWIEDHLITSTGIRAQALREAALLARLNDAIGRLIDAHLIRSDVRNDREWIELAHDRLVEPVRTANKAWRDVNLQLFQQRAKLWANAGAVNEKMLFLGDELLEAEHYASEHKDELSDSERLFLDESRRTAQAKSRARRFRIAGVLAGGVVLGIVSMLAIRLLFSKYQIFELSTEISSRTLQLKALNDELTNRQRLYVGIGLARDKPASDAIPQLLKIYEEIKARKPDNLSAFFDSSLLTTLRGIPGSVERELGGHSHIVRSLAFTVDGSRLISGSWDGTISVWQLGQIAIPDGKSQSTTEDQGAETYAVALYEPKALLASTYINGRIVLWRLADSGLQKLAVLDADRTGYRRQVTTTGFNHDGTLLATAGWDKRILLWDVSNASAPARIASFGQDYHQAPIQRIVFLPPDGKVERLASTDLEGKVRVWRIPASTAGGEVKPLGERDFAVSDILDRKVGLYSAAVSPDGRYLVAGDSEGYVYIWDLVAADPRTSGMRLTKAHHGHDDFNTEIYDIAFSANGREFASVGVDGVVLRWTLPHAPKTLRDLKDKMEFLRVGGLGERLFSVIYDPSRDGVIAVGGTRSVRLVDFGRRGSLLAAAIVPGDQSTGRWRAVSMDRESSTIAAARDDDHIFFWRHDSDGVVAIQKWTIDVDRRTTFALHPNGSKLVTVACGGKLTIWELLDGETPVPTLLSSGAMSDNSCPAAAPSFSQDGDLFAVAMASRLELWSHSGSDPWERQYVGAFDNSDVVGGGVPGEAPETITSLAFNADTLAVGGKFGHIRLLEIKNGRAASSSFRPDSVRAGKAVLSLAFKPDGTRLLSGGEDGFITEWTLPVLKRVLLDTHHERSVTSLAFASRRKDQSTGSPILVSADREGNVWEWNSGSTAGEMVPLALANGHPVRALALGTDGAFLVTAGDELLAWNFSREAMLETAQRFIKK
jgi:WD40 repeat protein